MPTLHRRAVARLLPSVLAVVLCAPPLAAQSPSAAAPAPRRVVVGTHAVPPFVIRDADGTWRGISIDLWRHVAQRMHLEYEIRELPVADLLAGRDPSVDVVVSMNITAEREATFDMSHAFYSTGLAIAVAPSNASVWQIVRTKVLTRSFLKIAGGAAALVFAAAAVMWLLERRRNPDEFGGRGGLVAGTMWAVETVIGYNDPQHRTRVGRAFGIGWAAIGVLGVSALTAKLSSELTVDEIASAIHGPDDLRAVRVGVVDRSGGQRFCQRRGMTCRAYPDADAALAAVERGEVGAVVHEAPILQYLAANRFRDRVRVQAGTFDNHGYGFALREGSALREPLNRELLEYAATEDWRTVLASYLGSAP
jgi:polar amino acid transport system substrate-binding protein